MEQELKKKLKFIISCFYKDTINIELPCRVLSTSNTRMINLTAIFTGSLLIVFHFKIIVVVPISGLNMGTRSRYPYKGRGLGISIVRIKFVR